MCLWGDSVHYTQCLITPPLQQEPFVLIYVSITTLATITCFNTTASPFTKKHFYREYLPPLIGARLMKQAGLKLLKNGFYYGYDASVDATIFNEFTTAALR